jgi:hypothetical protein
MSSAYHPQSDGQTERVNQCMETFLRCFANAIPTKWYDWLHLAEFWYNTSWHSALQQSPFYVLYGQSPRQLGIDASAACSVVSLDEWLQHRSTVQALIHQHLARAKNRMKMQADKNRTERTVNIGDWVYVKLQPYVQTSVAPRANQKLAYRFFGPYKIVSKIDTVAYKLQLPDTSTIHPVFHVSQLKGVVPVTQPVRPLPATLDDLQVPQRVLQKRVATVASTIRLQALIQWSGLRSAGFHGNLGRRRGSSATFSQSSSLGASWCLSRGMSTTRLPLRQAQARTTTIHQRPTTLSKTRSPDAESATGDRTRRSKSRSGHEPQLAMP